MNRSDILEISNNKENRSLIFLIHSGLKEENIIFEMMEEKALFINTENSIYQSYRSLDRSNKIYKNSYILSIFSNEKEKDYFSEINKLIDENKIQLILIDNFNNLSLRINEKDIINLFKRCKENNIRIISFLKSIDENDNICEKDLKNILFEKLFDKNIIVNKIED